MIWEWRNRDGLRLTLHSCLRQSSEPLLDTLNVLHVTCRDVFQVPDICVFFKDMFFFVNFVYNIFKDIHVCITSLTVHIIKYYNLVYMITSNWCYVMAYLYCRIQTQIQTKIRTPNPVATLHYAEVFTLHRVRFRFQSYLPTTGMGLESNFALESICLSVNEP